MTSFAAQNPVYINGFRVVRPLYETGQNAGFDWLARAHLEAERTARLQVTPGKPESSAKEDDFKTFERSIDIGLRRFGCSPEKISKRGHDLEDFCLSSFEDMKIYRLHESASGRNLEARMAFFEEQTDSIMDAIYSSSLKRRVLDAGQWQPTQPDLMIHVSCTGYSSPNATQRYISKRSWAEATESTQAYHMGCYAAVPAIRQASMAVQGNFYKSVDVLHNEMCTLHFDPSLHAAEQLVVQSLFADGHIAYRLSKNKPNGNGFRVLSTLEEIIPQSLTDMTWILSQNSFRMTLAREVPQKVAEAVPAFIQRLFAEAGLNSEQHLSHAIAALHPGGPRIIDGLKEILGLEEEALKDSRKILFECGNMSSATLPHIFHSVAQRNDVSSGTLVMGLAFGPGLTMVGVLLEKV